MWSVAFLISGCGHGLQDQPFFALVCNLSVLTTSSLSSATYAARVAQDYLGDQTGPVTIPSYDGVGKLCSNRCIQFQG